MTTNNSSAISDRIEAIEAAYEFMLAYAAQGRDGTEEGSGSEIRQFLTELDDALEGIGSVAIAGFTNELMSTAVTEPFINVVSEDASKTQSTVKMVLALQSISSQVVDNLNASIHVRALLTDLFLLDEIFKTEVGAK